MCALLFRPRHQSPSNPHQLVHCSWGGRSSSDEALNIWDLVCVCCAVCALQVINLRSLKPLDRDTILASARKTHNVLVLEEGWPQCGISSEIAAIVQESAFDDLDGPVIRLTGGRSAP